MIEAQRPNGELFGFDRACEISTQSASSIVEAAKKFGQQDDITVVSISRVPAAEPVAQTSAAAAMQSRPLPA